MDSISLLLALLITSTTNCTANRAVTEINYAYEISGYDIDFVGTIAQESMFDSDSIGDKGRAIGYCQYRRDYNRWGYDTYKSLGTWQEKMDMCYRSYRIWVDKGNISSRLYGYNHRTLGLKKLDISCQ